MKQHIGIDNGVSGSVTFLCVGLPVVYTPTPTKNELSYTKAKKNITRVDFSALRALFAANVTSDCMAVIERPMVNPGRFAATLSAMRCLEATLIVLEEFGVAYQYIDSRQWQKDMLPSGLEGPELKSASLDIGRRLFPSMSERLAAVKAKDCDSLLMAEWARRKGL